MFILAQFKPLEINFPEPENPFARPPWYQDPTTLLLCVLVSATLVGLFLYWRNTQSK